MFELLILKLNSILIYKVSWSDMARISHRFLQLYLATAHKYVNVYYKNNILANSAIRGAQCSHEALDTAIALAPKPKQNNKNKATKKPNNNNTQEKPNQQKK